MNKPLYICYSLPQMMFLQNNGIHYDVEGKHKVTNKNFWVFIRTDKLNNLLKEWSLNK